MTKTIEQCIAYIEEQLAQLKARAEAQTKAETDDNWPKNGDVYYHVTWNGEIDAYAWAGDGDAADKTAASIGNIYRTKEDAEREVERRKVLTQLRKLAKASGKCDWNGMGLPKWELFFNHIDNEWMSLSICYSQTQGAVYFATEESAKEAIETIGTDRLMLLLED